MKVKIDLSEINHSMTEVLAKNTEVINSCTSTSELVNSLNKIFSDNNLDTPASKRLILNVQKAKSYVAGLQTIYNSILCGTGNAVI